MLLKFGFGWNPLRFYCLLLFVCVETIHIYYYILTHTCISAYLYIYICYPPPHVPTFLAVFSLNDGISIGMISHLR